MWLFFFLFTLTGIWFGSRRTNTSTYKQIRQAYDDQLAYSIGTVATPPLEILCPSKKDQDKWNEFALAYYRDILVNDYFETL